MGGTGWEVPGTVGPAAPMDRSFQRADPPLLPLPAADRLPLPCSPPCACVPMSAPPSPQLSCAHTPFPPCSVYAEALTPIDLRAIAASQHPQLPPATLDRMIALLALMGAAAGGGALAGWGGGTACTHVCGAVCGVQQLCGGALCGLVALMGACRWVGGESVYPGKLVHRWHDCPAGSHGLSRRGQSLGR